MYNCNDQSYLHIFLHGPNKWSFIYSLANLEIITGNIKYHFVLVDLRTTGQIAPQLLKVYNNCRLHASHPKTIIIVLVWGAFCQMPDLTVLWLMSFEGACRLSIKNYSCTLYSCTVECKALCNIFLDTPFSNPHLINFKVTSWFLDQSQERKRQFKMINDFTVMLSRSKPISTCLMSSTSDKAQPFLL